MSSRARNLVTAAAAVALFLALSGPLIRMPAFGTYLGPYGDVLNNVAPRERKTPNIITAVNFDYRGLDTMGEEFILFAAVAGLTIVLRTDRADTTPEPLPSAAGRPSTQRSDALQMFGLIGIAATIAFGLYMALHPHLTPGGGFQGGAITAGFAALAFLALGYRPLRTIAGHPVAEPIEAIGAVGYVIVGIATLLLSGSFLANTLPLGRYGDLFSTGTIPVINLCVALEVLSGFLVMFAEFADETRKEKRQTPAAGAS